MSVPSAPRPISSFVRGDVADGQPTFDIPKAPTNVMQLEDSSSDEEEDVVPITNAPRAPVALRRRAQSDTSSVNGGGRKMTSFFGGIANLFKSSSLKKRERSGGEERTQWEQTRVDKKGGGRAVSAIGLGGRRRGEETSDEEGMPKNVRRVVNDPKARRKALSDIGRTTSSAPPLPPPVKVPAQSVAGKLSRKSKPAQRAASDIGTSPSIHPSLLPSPPAPFPRRRKSSAPPPISIPPPTPTTTTVRGEVSRSPTTTTIRGDLSRSNTITTIKTTATSGGTVKRKKKRTPAPTLTRSPPTAADLAQSLPSANRASFYETPIPEQVAVPPPAVVEKEVKGRVPKSVGEAVKRTRKESEQFGTDDWIAHPPGTGHIKPPSLTKKKIGHHAMRPSEADESLMAIVDRDEKAGRRVNGDAPVVEETSTSRTYATPTDGRTLSPDSAANGGGAPLQKRKSVRLAEGPSTSFSGSASPPSSIRSDSLAPPAKGILVHHLPPSGPPTNVGNVVNGAVESRGWESRRDVDAGYDSSDEGSEGGEYARARKALGRETRALEGLVGKDPKEKGKARAVDG